MKIVYFPATMYTMLEISDKENVPIPLVRWGVVDDSERCSDKYYIREYSAPSFICINGKTFDEFESEVEIHKIPKGLDACSNLLSLHQTISPKFEDCKKELGKINIADSDDIVAAINKGFLKPTSEINKYNLSAEIVKKGFYRIVKKIPEWTLTYGERKTDYYMQINDIYDTYNEALVKTKSIIGDWYENRSNALLIDFESDKLWLLNKLPEPHRSNVEFLLSTLTHDFGYSFRFYEGDILYKESSNFKYSIIYSINIK